VKIEENKSKIEPENRSDNASEEKYTTQAFEEVKEGKKSLILEVEFFLDITNS